MYKIGVAVAFVVIFIPSNNMIWHFDIYFRTPKDSGFLFSLWHLKCTWICVFWCTPFGRGNFWYVCAIIDQEGLLVLGVIYILPIHKILELYDPSYFINSQFIKGYLLTLVWQQLWNFLVAQLKFNRFLHLNEPPKRIFWYLIRPFDWRLSKLGQFQFLESILEAKIWLDHPENDFLICILN